MPVSEKVDITNKFLSRALSVRKKKFLQVYLSSERGVDLTDTECLIGIKHFSKCPFSGFPEHH